MTERRWHRARGVLASVLLLMGAAVAAGDEGAQGMLQLRWSALSERDGPAPDVQDLRSWLRWSAPLGAVDGRLHLEGWFRQGWGEDLDAAAAAGGAYRQRRQLRRLSVETGLGRFGRLEVGRQRPGLSATPALDSDGATWRWRGRHLSAALTAGAPVAYWAPDAGIDAGRLQAGAEVGWHPAGWETGVGLLREDGADGLSRWRLGLHARTPRRAGATAGVRLDVDPVDGRWISGRAHLTWRAGPWWLQVSGTEREVTGFPVADGGIDSLRYGGRSHELGARLQRRWGRSLTTTLSVRSHTGAREFRREALSLRWRGALLRRGVLFVDLSDSWSPWRRLERLRLDYTWAGWRRWTLSAGAAVTAFEWRTSRSPEWRVRARPELSLRWRPTASWSADLRVQETIDEFTHLRTGVTLGVTRRF